MNKILRVFFFISVFILPISFSAAEETSSKKTTLTPTMTTYLALFDDMVQILTENEEDPVEAEKQLSEFKKIHEADMEKLLETIQAEIDADIELKKIFSHKFQIAMRKVLIKLRQIALAAEKKEAEQKENEKKALPKEL